MRKSFSFYGILLELPAEIALLGTLLFSFSLWILWGMIWFPIIDWIFAQLAG